VDSVNLQVTGNAILGTDYIQSGNTSFAWPTKLIFAAGQDTIKICNISALQDNITEGSDTLSFSMTSFVTPTVSTCLSSNVVKFKNLKIKRLKFIRIIMEFASIINLKILKIENLLKLIFFFMMLLKK